MLLVLYFSLRLPFLHFYWLHLPGPFDLRAPLFKLDFISSSRFTLRFINPIGWHLVFWKRITAHTISYINWVPKCSRHWFITWIDRIHLSDRLWKTQTVSQELGCGWVRFSGKWRNRLLGWVTRQEQREWWLAKTGSVVPALAATNRLGV